MDALWEKIVDSPLLIGLLVAAIIVLWTTWRADAKQAQIDRAAMVESVEKMTEGFNALKEKIDSFFLTHFP